MKKLLFLLACLAGSMPIFSAESALDNGNWEAIDWKQLYKLNSLIPFINNIKSYDIDKPITLTREDIDSTSSAIVQDDKVVLSEAIKKSDKHHRLVVEVAALFNKPQQDVISLSMPSLSQLEKIQQYIKYNNVIGLKQAFEQQKDINTMLLSNNLLHQAAQYNASDAADFLIKFYKRIDSINTTDLNKNTALHNAAQYNSAKTAQLLIHNGAQLDTLNRWPQSEIFDHSSLYEVIGFLYPLEVALLYKSIETFYLLFKHTPPSAKNYTALLILAAQSNLPEVIQFLLQENPSIDINACFNQRRGRIKATPLEIATIYDNLEAAHMLVQHGAKGYDTSALQIGGERVLLDALTRYGSRYSVHTEVPAILQRAVEDNSLKVVAFIIQQYPATNLNAPYHLTEWSMNDTTLLERAEELGYTQMAKLLRRHGARTNNCCTLL